MSEELFPIEEITADSPRLAWMKRHDVHTAFSTCCEESPWSAWVGELKVAIEIGGSYPSTGGYAIGDSEDEAIAALAEARGIPLWNEESTP